LCNFRRLNSYTFHISLYDLAFVAAIFIGLTFAVLLWFTKTVNRSANRFLALALATMILWMARVLAIDLKLETYVPHWDRLPMQFLLALGPLVYFYVLKITRPQYQFVWKDLLHFSPVLLELGALAFEIKESDKTGAATYATHAFQQLNPVLQLLTFISVIIYLYRSHKLIWRFYKSLKPVLMDRPLIEFRWLRRLLAATALLWCLWIVFAAIGYVGYGNQLGVQVYYPFYILFAVIIIWTAAAAFLKPQAAVKAQTAAPVKQPVPVELRAKGAWLKRAMEANRYYEDPELSLSTLAAKLEIHPHELSRVINTVFKKGFNDFINEYRVTDAAHKMHDAAYDNMTLLGIGFEAGFNSQRTFNRVFKEMTGKTPVEYRNSVKKELPIDKLAALSRMRQVILRSVSPPVWAYETSKRNFMFRNYLKIAWRSIIRNKTFSFINICGLAVGMACSLLIFLWAQDENSYDRFNTHASGIYRVVSNINDAPAAVNPVPLAAAAKAQIPAVKAATRLAATSLVFSIGDKKYEEKNVFFADSNFLQIFTYPLVQGDIRSALHQPDGILITEAMAKKYFGNEDAIGKTLQLDNDLTKHGLVIMGVLKNIPANSHLQFNMLLPMAVYEHKRDYDGSWGNFDVYVYLQMEEHFAPTKQALAQVERKMLAIDKSFDKNITGGTYMLQPLTSVHLHSGHLLLDVNGQGSADYVAIFSMVAVFILIIACVNFMNLSTALSARRAKEVGLRKTIGALKFHLISQFIGEALLLSFIALTLAIGLTYLMLPAFNELAAKSINLQLFNIKLVLQLLGAALVTGLVAGSYPAFYLSRFQPVKVLKGLTAQGKGGMLRSGLVVLQFSISIVLIIATIVVYNQLQFIRNRNMGFNKQNLLYMQMPAVGDLYNNAQALKSLLNQHPEITGYTIINHLPTDLTTGSTGVYWPGKPETDRTIFPHLGIDENFVNTFGVQLLAGRSFSHAVKADEHNFLMNETALKLMHMPAGKAIGMPFELNGDTGKLIGVVKDFNFKTVHQTIEPLVIKYSHTGGFLVVRTPAENVGKTTAQVKDIFNKVYGNYPVSSGFIDEDIAHLYASEQQMGKLFNVFSVLSVIVSCLGLFGLATFAMQRRFKEIGVRKVLGASVTGIVNMLSKDFLKLVALAALIAYPAAWWVMHSWLQNFAYHITLSWSVFILAGVLAVVIAFLTISYQAIKAAMANPVKSLRSE
jgi:putative ABC transport system permease protein